MSSAAHYDESNAGSSAKPPTFQNDHPDELHDTASQRTILTRGESERECPELPGDWNRVWEVIGCGWTFHIVRLLDADAHHFNAIGNSIDGLPGSTLSARLEELQDHEIVSRTVMDSTPPTVECALTEKGCEVAAVADQLTEIGRRWDE